MKIKKIRQSFVQMNELLIIWLKYLDQYNKNIDILFPNIFSKYWDIYKLLRYKHLEEHIPNYGNLPLISFHTNLLSWFNAIYGSQFT